MPKVTIKGDRTKCAVKGCGAPATHLVWRAFDMGLVPRPDVCEKHYKEYLKKSESMTLGPELPSCSVNGCSAPALWAPARLLKEGGWGSTDLCSRHYRAYRHRATAIIYIDALQWWRFWKEW